MVKPLIAASLAFVGLIAPVVTAQETPEPAVPNTAVVQNTLQATVVAPERTHADKVPVRVIIPSIGLNAPIEQMGLTSSGALDVPSGKTNNVGWYAAGTLPGEVGSAVLDAHVFAALKNLKYVEPG